MANTNILIKRSTTVGKPGSLLAGELAYSYASNTIFIGSPTGNGVVNVGGQYYTSQVDNATSAATGLTLVKRDSSGNASFNFITANIIGDIQGTANAATQLETARNFSISGTDITASTQSFDGSAAIVLNAALNAVPGLSAGTYGSTTQIPSVTVAANGRVIAISTNNVATDLEVVGDSGNTTIDLLTETLSLTGGAGITSTVTNNQVTFDVDNTVVRANTPIALQTIDSSLTINGNLTVLGTQTTINTQSLNVVDPMIYLAANNTVADAVDIGFAGGYNDGSQRATGVFRNAGNKEFYVFDNYDKALNANNEIDVADASFRTANVNASYFKGNVIATTISSGALSLSTALPVASGGTGQSSFTTGQVIIGSGINGLGQLANVSSINTSITSNSTVNNLTTDVYGRVTNYTTQAIAGLTVSQGGTGDSTFSSGGLLIGNGTDAIGTLANTTFVATNSYTVDGGINRLGGVGKTITSVSVDEYGRFKALTYTDISGLQLNQGGTGVSSFTPNGVTYGNGSSAMGVTAAAGTADQTWSNQVLTTTDAGVPVWTTALDGGTF